MDEAASVILFLSYALLISITKLMGKKPNHLSYRTETQGKKIFFMKGKDKNTGTIK
jgi:hypothetical protein